MRLLIIEDNKEISGLLKVSLEEEGFAVDTADDGEKGSYFARTNNYDLIILDNMLPKKEGVEVCKEIRGTGNNVPIIILSALSDTNTKINLLNTGADDYLTKPFSLGELLARVRALLRRPKKIISDIYNIDDLTLDTKKYFVERGGTPLRLTRKEFALLEYLMKNQDIVLSRGMIMENVWDMNADPFSNTIESHMVSLRRKIDSRGKEKLIHTVPGRGYKFGIHNG